MNLNDWTEQGRIHYEKREIDQAIQCCEEALKIDPALPLAHINLAECYLLQEKYGAGYQEYEWRFKYYPELLVYMSMFDPAKRWSGFSSLKDKRIAVFFEQGYGDAIQYVRYIKQLKTEGCHIVAVCLNSLYYLFKTIPHIDEIHVKEDCFKGNLPEYDYHIPSMSLPSALSYYKLDPEPYLPVRATTIDTNKFKIGIAWKGSGCKENDPRPCDLDLFKSIATPERELWSVCNICPNKDWLIDYHFAEFWETAITLKAMDLVISIDTCILHLAGAIGVPTAGLLSTASDFRWGLSGSKCPIYDSVTLFRQKELGNWKDVFENELIPWINIFQGTFATH